MTLITHIRTKSNIFLVSDSAKRCLYISNKEDMPDFYLYDKVRKVFQYGMFAVATFGNYSEKVEKSLANNQQNCTSISELSEVLNTMIFSAKINGDDDFSFIICDPTNSYLLNVGINGKQSLTPFSFRSLFNTTNIHDINDLCANQLFFSPQYLGNDKIDIDFINSIFNLFKEVFIKIYQTEFDIEKISPDDKFLQLMDVFYGSIYEHENLHRYCIKGDIQISYFDTVNQNWNFFKVKSELGWYQIPTDKL